MAKSADERYVSGAEPAQALAPLAVQPEAISAPPTATSSTAPPKSVAPPAVFQRINATDDIA